MSLTDEQICFLSQLNPPHSYILIGNRVRIKSSGMAPGLANARPLGQHNICKCPAVARGGGGEGGLGAAGID